MSRRGLALAECVVALATAAVVLGALHLLLLAAARSREREHAAREVRTALHVAAAVLRADLQGVSAPGGDLLAVDDSALTARVARGQGAACAQPAPDRLTIDSARGTWLRDPDPARDVARIFLDGDPDDTADDGWWVTAVAAAGRGTCPDGSPAITLALVQGPPAPVTAGAPVRVLETVEFRRYRDAAGTWWLGSRTRSAGGWTVTSPIAGPLRPGDGLSVRAVSVTGAPAATPSAAAALDVVLRARSGRTPVRHGGARAPLEDSLRLLVAVVP